MGSIGEKIRKIRSIKGYSQEFMASQLGMSQNNYSRIELNRNKLNLETLDEIAKILEVDPLDILKFDVQFSFSVQASNENGSLPRDGSARSEVLITELKNEVNYLRSENKRLLSLLEQNGNGPLRHLQK